MATNPKRRNKMAPKTRGSKRGWVALAGRVPPDLFLRVVADMARRGVDRSTWVAEAVAEKLDRAA